MVAIPVFVGMILVCQEHLHSQQNFEGELLRQLEPISRSIWNRVSRAPIEYEQHVRVVDKRKGDRLVHEDTTKVTVADSLILFVEEQQRISELPGASHTSSAAGKNTKYEFRLERAPERSEWLLSSWKFLNEPDKRDHVPVRYRAEAHPIFSHLTLFGRPLFEVMKEPGWKTIDVRQVPQQADRVQITFDYQSKRKSGAIEHHKGSFDLKPSLDWAVVHSVISTEIISAGETHFLFDKETTFEVHSDEQGIPFLRKLSWKQGKLVDSHLNVELECVAEFSQRRPSQVSERNFTLSAFGLPEPAGVEWRKATPRYVWVLIAAGAVAILATVFRCLARRCNGPAT
jgi:hypothetical protein